MRIAGKRIPTGSRRQLTVFCLGILAGFFVINFGKSIMLEHTGMLDEDTLYRLKYMSVDGNALFCYVLRKRMTVFLAMAVLATTYLGYAVCMGAAAWCGMSAGVFLSALFLRYGLKGLILALVSVFPQFLFYIPAVIMMLGWSEDLYRAIYSRGRTADIRERSFVLKKAGWLGAIALIILLGCLLEGYLNPGLLIGYLKVF
ncbi:MAG: stage II sporulation protein M [Roseburia sp.]|nr:stage II sporulation protein M [Roseburia sp.]MCM1097176.1 stage II sporulation protein M [Ruminococcus flavefaciens]